LLDPETGIENFATVAGFAHYPSAGARGAANHKMEDPEMASITEAKLSITHDHNKKTARPIVRCTVKFTALELCQMKQCPEGAHFKLKCQLWGEDSGLTGADDFLFTYGAAFFFPDATPATTESRTFDVVLGEGVLDEDFGQDEVYAKVILQNLSTLVKVTKNSNVVSHSF
jgi:hypothetical protein